MKHPILRWFLLTIFILLLLPLLTVLLIQSSVGMLVVFFLFFAVNPVYSVLTGILAGKYIQRLWFLPLIVTVLYLVGAWFCFDPGEPAFLSYAAAYLALGLVAMAISNLRTKKREEKYGKK